MTCLVNQKCLCFKLTFFGVWPSGKAPVFGIGIAGSNPATPAKRL